LVSPTQIPSEALTVSGNVHVTGSNAMIYGTGGMKMYSVPSAGENKIENIVSSGKGLNFYASTTSTMGDPKMTILESSNVGIGTSQPQSRFQTSGGSAFINQQVTRRNNYNHLNTPLVVNNTTETTVINSTSNVMQLTREGTGSKYGARAAFKLGKWDMTDSKSKTRLDIDLADDDYAVDTNIITIRSDGKVGIGHSQPEAYLEVKCEGIAQPGMVVHNHDNGDAIISMKSDLASGNAFTSYVNGNGAWSTGVTGAGNDFRITENETEVSDVTTTAVYISGSTRDVGIGTDAPRVNLKSMETSSSETHSHLVVSQVSEFGNTQFVERRYTEAQPRNELVLFKGNEASTTTGPDRIRHLAAQHVFQTYSGDGDDFDTLLTAADSAFTTSVPLLITPSGRVVIGGTDTSENEAGVNASTKLIVAGNIVFTGGGSLQVAGLDFETATIGGTSINKIRSVLDGTTRRPLTFTHQLTAISDEEYARFDGIGRLGIGTDSPTSNLHLYSSTTENVNMLRLQSPGTNKHTGVLIYTNDGEGGFLRGFSDSGNGTTGLVMGTANNAILTNCIHMIHTSNVGIGISTPNTKFHVYNGVHRVEHSSSNAVIEFKTTGGTSNILSDTLGNVYINPASTQTVINSNVIIQGALDLEGAIDLGDAVGINLGGAAANTALHVNGGIITNSDQVACKRYSHTFTRGIGEPKDIQLYFDDGSFYAKVICILREYNSSVSNMSTMILELQGGTHDQTTSTVPIAIGTKNIFGGTNNFPWDPTVTTGINGVLFQPYDPDVNTRYYSYDISVELVSSKNGKLKGIYANNPGIDNFNGTPIKIDFNY
jgi:hypothetical protein